MAMHCSMKSIKAIIYRTNHLCLLDSQRTEYFCKVAGTPKANTLDRKKKNTQLKSCTQKNEKLFDLIPKSFRKSRSNFDIPYSFVTDRNVAENIIRKIRPFLEQDVESVVMEANPGLGLITEKLLKLKIPQLIIYDTLLTPSVKNIINRFKSKVKLNSTNILDVSERIEGTFDFGIYHAELNNYKEKTVKLIGINPSRVFFRRIMQTIILADWDFGLNVEFYFVMNKEVYQCLTALFSWQSKCQDFGVFHVLMDIKILGELPRDKFVPWSISKEKVMYLTRIVRKKTIHGLKKEDLPLYWNFLRLIGSSKYNFVIAALENWYPGSGPYFIAKGLSVTTRTNDLNAEELVILFKQFLKLEGYEDMIEILRDDRGLVDTGASSFEKFDELTDEN